MIRHFLPALLSLLVTESVAQSSTSKPYLGEQPPGMKPKVFAPGLVSMPDVYEFGSVFSNDGNEFYYGMNVGEVAHIRRIVRTADGWSKPETIIRHDVYSHNDPFLSKDDGKLFFISDRPASGSGPKKDYDIWYMTREGKGWSKPINAGPSINTSENEYYISFTDSGAMYFASNGRVEGEGYQICRAARSGNGFSSATVLPEGINSDSYEADVFVAPDESYVIFCSERQIGFGKGDLYISFRSRNGEWSKAKNMGNEINTDAYEFCPFVTRDGKYFFYTSRKDIYWVDAKVIDGLR